jgi:general secretion pathway protein I
MLIFRKDSGFSLTEVLVALAISAISLGILLRIFGGALNISNTIEEFEYAVLSIRSLQNQLGIEIPLTPGDAQGQLDGDRRWHLKIYPYTPTSPAPTQDVSASFEPFWVELEVEWGSPTDPRALNLKTLRLIPKTQNNKSRM